MTTVSRDGLKNTRIRFKARVNPKATLDLNPTDQVSFVPMEAVGDDGSLLLDRTRPVGEVSQGYTYFEDGDVSIAKITPCFENGKGAVMDGLTGGAGFGTTELIVLRPEAEISPKFLYYVTQSHQFRSHGEAAMLGSGGQKRVPDLFVKDFATRWPTGEVQIAIASYLDVETARIDGLIEEKTRLLRYLLGMRSAVIVAAMANGADGEHLAAYPGAPWMGRLPSHWTRMALTRVVESACDGPFGSSLKSEHYTDEGIPVIRLQNIGDGDFLPGDPAFISEEYFRDLGGHDAAPGDMVVASLGDDPPR